MQHHLIFLFFLIRDVEKLRQPLHHRLDVHVHQGHPVIRILLHDRHQRQTSVDFPQHDGFVAIVQHQAALGSWTPNLVVQLRIPRLALQPLPPFIAALPRAVHLSNIDDDVDVVRADLVARHVGSGTISGDVDLGEHVEEVGFLEAACTAKIGEHGFQGSQAGDELLDDFAEGFEDGVVVDGRQVEGDGGVLEAVVGELVLDADGDVALDVELVVVGEAVDFVDEDFDVDVGVAALQDEDGGVEAHDGLEIVVLSVDNPDQGANVTENGIQIVIR